MCELRSSSRVKMFFLHTNLPFCHYLRIWAAAQICRVKMLFLPWEDAFPSHSFLIFLLYIKVVGLAYLTACSKL